MDRRSFLRASGAVVTGGAVGSAGCVGTTPTVEMRTESPSHYFDPIGLSVDSGTTVTFEAVTGIHSTSAYHTRVPGASVTRLPEAAAPWDSKLIDSVSATDPTFEHTFEAPGTYDYFCRNHRDDRMVGRIVVEDPGGPADGSQPPDGRVPGGERIVAAGSISRDEFGDR